MMPDPLFIIRYSILHLLNIFTRVSVQIVSIFMLLCQRMSKINTTHIVGSYCKCLKMHNTVAINIIYNFLSVTWVFSDSCHGVNSYRFLHVCSQLCGSSAFMYSLPCDWFIECSSIALMNRFDPKVINYSHLTISHKSGAATMQRD